LGKLELSISLRELFDLADKIRIEIVQITFDHLITLSKLPNHSSDPFDRLIVAQAMSEDLVLITKDKGLKKYKVKQKWA
jgi:PIN domain nuclease of toxin-antitoxin system